MRQALSRMIGLALALALAGCFPGQFPSPEVRSPPAPQLNGTQGATTFGFGAPVPTPVPDAGGG